MPREYVEVAWCDNCNFYMQQMKNICHRGKVLNIMSFTWLLDNSPNLSMSSMHNEYLIPGGE